MNREQKRSANKKSIRTFQTAVLFSKKAHATAGGIFFISSSNEHKLSNNLGKVPKSLIQLKLINCFEVKVAAGNKS